MNIKPQKDGKPQTSFSAWVRERGKSGALPSSSFATTDVDWIWHGWNLEYKTENGIRTYRHVRYFMLIEEKAWSASPDFSQHDTINLFNKMLKESFGRNGKRRGEKFITDRKESAVLRYYGYHLLQYSESDMAWDQRPITLDILESILRFETDPEDIDVRISRRLHHASNSVIQSETTPLGFPAERVITLRS
jgi:hypothetical protein